MIQLVIGWVENILNFSTPGRFKPVEEIAASQLTPSQRGYHFEHKELKRLMQRLKGFGTVEFTDVGGTSLTPESIDARFGKDGGIDCVIRIIAPTEAGAKNVATRIRNIIVNGDY